MTGPDLQAADFGFLVGRASLDLHGVPTVGTWRTPVGDKGCGVPMFHAVYSGDPDYLGGTSSILTQKVRAF
jgi:hypothetical protein